MKEKMANFLKVLVLVCSVGYLMSGCARLPYTTSVVHEDQRVAVMIQREVSRSGYSHPVQLAPADISAILSGFSLREQQRMPLRWFAEETPPNKIFRQDELQVLAPQISDALQKVGPEERVYFMLFAPGMNPRYRRDVTGGWIAVRDQFLHLTIDYFHAQQPVRKSDLYDFNYPTAWSPPKPYLLYFEPGRFYTTDPQSNTSGVSYREFLKTIPSP